MSWLRKIIGASFAMGAAQLAMQGFTVREMLVSGFVYVAVLILFPSPTPEEQHPTVEREGE